MAILVCGCDSEVAAHVRAHVLYTHVHVPMTATCTDRRKNGDRTPESTTKLLEPVSGQ